LAAVKYAVKLLCKIDSDHHRITLINVHDDSAFRHAMTWVGKEVVNDYFLELGAAELKSAKKFLATANIEYDVEIKIGRVAEEILASAKAGKFDLIVLGAKDVALSQTYYSALLLTACCQLQKYLCCW
jgi:nucleotide-binding universal stress UspA family protein